MREYTLLDKCFATSYGFTEQEADELLDQVPIVTDPALVQWLHLWGGNHLQSLVHYVLPS